MASWRLQGAPPEVIGRLREAVQKIVKEPAFRARLVEIGSVPGRYTRSSSVPRSSRMSGAGEKSSTTLACASNSRGRSRSNKKGFGCGRKLEFVGAGPAGQTLSHILNLAGIRVWIAAGTGQRRTHPAHGRRARGLKHGTVDSMKKVGLWPPDARPRHDLRLAAASRLPLRRPRRTPAGLRERHGPHIHDLPAI